MNTLFYGDNLEVLRRHIRDESVDLVYLDPPFNSAQDYNVLFKEQDGKRSAAQIKAFEDTWEWNQEAARTWQAVVEGGGNVSRTMQAFRQILGENDMLAYLAMMAPRLVELHRVLKPTGSIYLHCDPSASHYLKLLMDAVFNASNHKNEIVWKRTGAHSSSKRYGPVHDIIFYYTKSSDYTWNQQYIPHNKEYIQGHYTQIDADGRRWMPDNLTAAGTRNGSSGKTWRGYDVTAKGNHWKFTYEHLEDLDARGLIHWPANGGWPRYKRYLDTVKGVFVQDTWTTIDPLNSQAAERLGYPTQKPEALLERIIRASSNEGDVVLDPFCGCGTAIAAAQKLGRRWLGIDITHLAIGLIKTRLRDTYGADIAATYQVVGEPATLPDAVALAAQDKYQFQYWALGLVGARPMPAEQKKGADRGIDGRIYFHDGDPKGATKQVIFSVKGGHTDVTHLRDLRGVVDREGAQIGVLIALQEPTGPMRAEAASGGFYDSPWGGRFPRLQLLTIRELLEGQRVAMPNVTGMNVTFKRAPKAGAGATVTKPTLPASDTAFDEDDETEEAETDEAETEDDGAE